MSVFAKIRRIGADRSGAAAIEFGILGPLLITMMIGVLQFGMGMQAYNAMRSASADVARYAVVQRQKGVAVDAAGLTTEATTIATASPYKLLTANLTSSVTLDTAGTQVAGATRYKIQYTYSVPNFLKIVSLPNISLTYSRPIFVVT